MSCTATSVIAESFEEPTLGTSSGASLSRNDVRRRRHSSYHHRPWLADQGNLYMMVDNFLSELGRRLDFLESYGQLRIDAGIERAYSTLHAVREACAHACADGMIGAGRRRANILVETLEERYKEVLAKKDTMEAKVYAGLKLLEGTLADFEARAYAVRDSGLTSVAHDLLDGSWRRMDEGIETVKGVMDEGLDRAWRAKEHVKESLEHAVERALVRAKEHGLIKYEDLPAPWRTNPHILRGYRFNETHVDCIRSVLTVSNELVNIWSHAIGLLIVLSIAFYFYPTSVNFHLSTNTDVFIASIFFFAACKCLVCSTMWHTMNSIAEKTLMERFACVDYTGISLLVAASIMTTEYTAFYCEPLSRWLYMSTTAALGVGGVILPWHPTFNRSDMAWLRVLFYVGLACTGWLPIGQIIATRGFAWAYYFYAPIMKSLLVYLFGAILYAAKVPERWFPGKFDYIGGSHNLWHFAVLGGILFHYMAMHDLFAQAFARAQTVCPVY